MACALARSWLEEPAYAPLGWGGRRTLCRVNLLIPVFLVATVIVTFTILMGEAPPPPEEYYFKYTTVPGYFLQDDPKTDPKGFDYTTTNFGLIDRAYDADVDSEKTKTQWQRFENQVAHLNENSGSNVQYKVLYMGRHGEGFHNVAEAKYGTQAWDCYWSLLDGDDELTWTDAHLTQIGINQAQKANNFWRSLISDQKISTPESYYASPLIRCLETANVTFSGLDLPSGRPFIPLIKELFREVIGVHTCDRRSTKTVIHKQFPDWLFEDGFKEDDLLYSAELRETAAAQDQRIKVVLDDLFENDEKTLISISSHSGAIASILRVLGHRDFSLGTGQMIPVFVKAEKIAGKLPVAKKEPWEAPKTCKSPPSTSI